jgi:predicted DNA-binding transcriptional regulator AlpA
MDTGTHQAVEAIDAADVLLPDPKVTERYGITAMTLWRWDHDEKLNFPPPIRIGRRKYRKLSELVAFERDAARRARPAFADTA